jgi:hypothetical protein
MLNVIETAQYKRKYIIGMTLAILMFLAIFPGIDLAAYHFLNPTTYWQKFVFIAEVVFTAFPMILAAAFSWLGVVSFFGL